MSCCEKVFFLLNEHDESLKARKKEASLMNDDKGVAACEGKVLHVANVPEDATHGELVKIFRKLRPTEVFLCDRVHPVRQTRYAFVTFRTAEDAAFALSDCTRRARFLHGRILAVSVSRASPQRCAVCGEILHRADVLWHTALLHSSPAAEAATAVAALDMRATAPSPALWGSPAACAAFVRAVTSALPPEDAALAAAVKTAAVDALQAMVRDFWGAAELACYGSAAAGVPTALSDDIDVALRVDLTDRATGAPWAERGTLCALRRLLEAPARLPPAAGSLALTLDARVPVLSYRPAHPLAREEAQAALAAHDGPRLLRGTRVDLCVNRTVGVLNTRLLRDYAAAGADPDATRAFLAAVRRWARTRRLVRPRDGFLNAYCVQLMAVAFLQQAKWVPNLQDIRGCESGAGDANGDANDSTASDSHAGTEGAEQTKSDFLHGGLAIELGSEHWWRTPEAAATTFEGCRDWDALSLFAHFLHYYAVEFDWDACAVDIAAPEGSGAVARPPAASATPAALCVLDPIERGFNVARHLSPLHRSEIVAQMQVDLARLHRVSTAVAAGGDDTPDYAFLFEPV